MDMADTTETHSTTSGGFFASPSCLSTVLEPVITQSPADLPDDPRSHYWRAEWDCDGVILSAMPVVKKTLAGVWVALYAQRRGWDGSWDIPDEIDRRWVATNGNRSYAKPTRKAAIFSLAIRLEKRAQYVANTRRQVMEHAEWLKKLYPEHARYADAAQAELR